MPISGCEKTAVAIMSWIGRCRLVTIERVDQAHGLVDGYRRQLDAVGDVANGVDVVDTGPRIFVHE